MALVNIIDLRLNCPITRCLASPRFTIGFSKGCDLVLPRCVSSEFHSLMDGPILDVERLCRGGFAVTICAFKMSSLAEGPNLALQPRIKLSTHPFLEPLNDVDSKFVTVKSGDCVAVSFSRVNRTSPVLDIGRDSWPVCALQIWEPGVDEEPFDGTQKSFLLNLLPELQLKILSYVDFKTLTCFLPAVCRSLFYTSKRVLANPVDFRLRIEPGVPIRQFLTLYCGSLSATRFGSVLETIELVGRGQIRVKAITVDLGAFIRLFPNLTSLTVGGGIVKFATPPLRSAPHPPFESRIRRLALHWDAMTNFHDRFPFATHMPMLESVAVVSACEGFTFQSGVFHERNLTELARLPCLRDLTLAWCSLVPSVHWVSFFESIRERRIEVLRVPGCAGIADETLQAISNCFPTSLKFLEVSSVRSVTDSGISFVLRHCRGLEALCATHLVALRGSGWLPDVTSGPGASLKYLDAAGSPCSRSVPAALKSPDVETFSLLRRGQYRHLMT